MITPNNPDEPFTYMLNGKEYSTTGENIVDVDSFLLPTNYMSTSPQILDFCPTDTQERFSHNKLTQPADWIYHNKEVKYHMGTHGYRCPEYEDIDWNNSILFFGDSNLFGVGLDESDTVTSVVKNLTGYDTINLSIGGTGPLFNLINQTRIAESNIKPKAVVNMWPSYERMFECTVEDNKPKLIHYGGWQLGPEDPQYDLREQGFGKGNLNFLKANLTGVSGSHVALIAKEQRRMASVLWKDICHIELTYARMSQRAFDIDHIEMIDKSRDLMHPGIETHLMVAKHIASLLQAQGL